MIKEIFISIAIFLGLATSTPATVEVVPVIETPQIEVAANTPVRSTETNTCPAAEVRTIVQTIEVPVEKIVEKVVTVTDSSRISELERQLADERIARENVVSARTICEQVLKDRKDTRNRVIERMFPGVLVNGEIDSALVSSKYGVAWNWSAITKQVQIEEANAGLPERQDAYCQ